MESWKENVSAVLVGPREQGNVGAAARALKNMGFHRLELVKPVPLGDEARWMACQAVDVVESAVIHGRLRDALLDKSLVVGTTRRLGKQRGPVLPLREGVKRIVKAARKNRVAVLFGREDKGLTNREIEECAFLLTIPTDPVSPSLNLAQSVLLVAYELSRRPSRRTAPRFVALKELELLYRHIDETLRLLDYIPKGNRDLGAKIMRNLKHIAGRAGLTDWECRMLHGICAQVEKKVKGEK